MDPWLVQNFQEALETLQKIRDTQRLSVFSYNFADPRKILIGYFDEEGRFSGYDLETLFRILNDEGYLKLILSNTGFSGSGKQDLANTLGKTLDFYPNQGPVSLKADAPKETFNPESEGESIAK